MAKTFSALEFETLRSIIGSKTEFIGGPNLTDFFVSSQIILGTTSGQLTFSAEAEVHDFAGYPDDFVAIRIVPSSRESLEVAQAEHRIYKRHFGEVITGVDVVRETVSAIKESKVAWKFDADVAVLVHVNDGTLCFTLEDHHMEIISFTDFAKGQPVQVPETMSQYEDDLFFEFRVERKILSLN